MVKNLRFLRNSKGISQQQLADAINTSQQSINKYENHNVEPDIATLMKLAAYFQTTVDYLVGYDADLSEDSPYKGLEFSKEEVLLIQKYRALSKEEKASIQLILKNYLKNKPAVDG